ncbi:phosphate ABC transporter substrate-binding protein [Anaerocolumna xylanovorans]|uniref:Phosphate-binding protein n=1 Tax=Anaerocolumna xylanovorans DSM 12503 TaxID=1121345 RepID=A0A1M7YHM4_9FIRM|nr:phosphate ABC transporter substrate-binding protein [Anaerocolumna xylanovorans]SHO52103.1 phosphate transport system substrate-binding protein [Anaerocolumna xylanovorans DSM 12503]
MKLKNKVLAVLLTIALVGVLGGCGKTNNTNSNTSDNTTTEPTQAATETPAATDDTSSTDNLSGTVTITGSTSVEKILNDMIDEFTASNPDVTINYTGTGSSAGISDSIAGANDIGASSRDLKDDEKSAGLKEVTFAYDGIAIAVNPANTLTDISVEDLAKIFSGQITNWKDVGGKDATIVVVSREGASGTRSAFEELVKLEDAGGLTEDATVAEGNGSVQTTVAGNENAIGYVSFSYIDSTVKALTVNGVEGTPENAKSGTYVLSRPFLFVYDEAKASAAAKAFVEFSLSDDGQAFVEKHGGIKLD